MPMKKVSAMLWIVGVCLACKPAQPDVSTEFVGVEGCASCHMEAYQKWQRTTHATSMQEATPQTVKGDFTKDNVYTFGGVTSTMSLRDGRYFITTPGADGSQGTHEVLYTIGDRIPVVHYPLPGSFCRFSRLFRCRRHTCTIR